MNLFTSQTSDLFLPLSNLSPHLTRLNNALDDRNVTHEDRCLLEHSLWTKVKESRKLGSDALLRYLIDYYQKLLLLAEANKTIINDLFHYNVLIRLGDLNRYVSEPALAAIYYYNAKTLFPSFGYAYNQLGLLADPTDIYKLCYYYARAGKSCERPLKIADSNLRIAAKNRECEILDCILDDQTGSYANEVDAINGERQIIKPPETASQWFHVMVVALYADNVQSIVGNFLRFLSENFSTQTSTSILDDGAKVTSIYCDMDGYMLLASHDILLDWLRLGSQGVDIVPTISQELRRVRSSLMSVLLSLKYNSDERSNESGFDSPARDPTKSSSKSPSANTTGGPTTPYESATDFIESFKPDISSSTISVELSKDSLWETAMIHDYALRGFGPLHSVHRQLSFPADSTILDKVKQFEQPPQGPEPDQRFVEGSHLRSLLIRLKTKTDTLVPPIKKQTRNIALQSILSIADAQNSQ